MEVGVGVAVKVGVGLAVSVGVHDGVLVGVGVGVDVMVGVQGGFTSTGHVALEPSHVSARSHAPALARQTVPPVSS